MRTNTPLATRNLTLFAFAAFGIASLAKAQTCTTVDHDEDYIGVGLTWTLSVPCGGSTTLARYQGIWRTVVGGGESAVSSACGTTGDFAFSTQVHAADVAFPGTFGLPGDFHLSEWTDDSGEIAFAGRYRGLMKWDGSNSVVTTDGLVYHCTAQYATYDIDYAVPEGCQAVLTCEWSFSVSCWSALLLPCGDPTLPGGWTQNFGLEETFGFETTNQLHRINSIDGQMSVAGLAQQAYNYSPLYQVTTGDCINTFHKGTGDLMGGATITRSYLLPTGATSIQLYHRMRCSGSSAFGQLLACGEDDGEHGCEEFCIFDLDGNCSIDISDLLLFLNLMEAGTIDLNGDGATDIDDMIAMLSAFELGGCPE